MPEFTLDRGSPEASRKFSEQSYFVQGYIEAMFFTQTGTGDDEELENATVADLSSDAWRVIIRDCANFQAEAAPLLEQAYELDDYDETQAGRDYWFTRNGHGVGFWDRQQLTDIQYFEDGQAKENLGERLSELCRHDNVDLIVGDDGLLYL